MSNHGTPDFGGSEKKERNTNRHSITVKDWLISKALHGILNSSKKRTKTNQNTFSLIFFSFLVRFLKELKTRKIPFEINWPLAVSRTKVIIQTLSVN